jgi:hypothetical protein
VALVASVTERRGLSLKWEIGEVGKGDDRRAARRAGVTDTVGLSVAGQPGSN